MMYHVIRQHYGDRLYLEGETRELDAATAGELVQSGILRERKDVQNKAEPENARRKKAEK